MVSSDALVVVRYAWLLLARQELLIHAFLKHINMRYAASASLLFCHICLIVGGYHVSLRQYTEILIHHYHPKTKFGAR